MSLPSPPSASVLIVDDQEPFRAVARMVVRVTEGFDVIGEAGSGEEAVGFARESAPDLVLMDINLPGINGIEATRRVLAERPDTVVILLSTYDAGSLPSDAADSGAARYVHKEDFSPALLAETWEAARCCGAGATEPDDAGPAAEPTRVVPSATPTESD